MSRTLHLKDGYSERNQEHNVGEVERRIAKIEKRIEKVGRAMETGVNTYFMR
jgi:hypothetical protein